jgi:dTDP-4-dehydrorhamnose 3,5-epimerase
VAADLIFEPTEFGGLLRIRTARSSDARGFYERAFCERTFRAHGLRGSFAQHGLAYNLKRGTLRGLHFQKSPHAETKLVHCVEGAVFDVIVDLRSDSQTYGRWLGFNLSAASGEILYVGEGLAHGYITLTETATLHYCISPEYEPAASSGVRWDDPALAIAWPIPPTVISDRDRRLPVLEQLGGR